MALPVVVVVGHCASGKTTVVEALRHHDYDARAVAQEHSDIVDLWKHPAPEILVFLDVSLAKVRERKGNPEWPGWIYDLQSTRLAGAHEQADVVVDTSLTDARGTIQQVVGYLKRRYRRENDSEQGPT